MHMEIDAYRLRSREWLPLEDARFIVYEDEERRL